MAWNNDQVIERNLERCYELDFDWELIPKKLQNICEIWGKRMKQQKTTVLLALLTVVSFVLGHASVTVKDGWDEPIVVWLAVVLKTGLFARGNSHVIRLAVPLHFLFKPFENDDDYENQANMSEDPGIESSQGTFASQSENLHMSGDPDAQSSQSTSSSSGDENDVPEKLTQNSSESENPLSEEDENDSGATTIERRAIEVAQSIVKTCLHHVCIMNNNSRLLTSEEENEDMLDVPIACSQFTGDEQRGYASILLCPGSIVSLSRFVIKGKFKKVKVGNLTGGAGAGKHLFNVLSKKGLAQTVQFRVRRNNTSVLFLKKRAAPEDLQEKKQFANQLALFGVTLREYIAKYEEENEESASHRLDFEKRGSQEDCSPSPTKVMRVEADVHE